MTFGRVVNRMPSGPYTELSPNSESFHPPKLCAAAGTGIGTLIPTMPTVAPAAKASR